MKLLNAYYMPDPKPPANSNTVEGELKPSLVGKIFEPLQRLYQEYADFGGARVILQNTTDEQVQIGRIELNGRPSRNTTLIFSTESGMTVEWCGIEYGR